jgi:hypothetical protein
MQPSNDNNRRRLLTATCAIALGLLFLTAPLTHLLLRGGIDTPLAIAMRGFAAPVHMALLVGAVFGITQLLRRGADRIGLIGGSLTIIGWAVGIRILLLGQLESLLVSGVSGVPANSLAKMFEATPIIWFSIVPMGLLFPIGMVTLGMTLVVTHAIPRPIGALLILGAVLFPIGRIGGLPWALVSCDLILGLAFALLGWQLFIRTEAWNGEEGAV